jgi:hypothetical protein
VKHSLAGVSAHCSDQPRLTYPRSSSSPFCVGLTFGCLLERIERLIPEAIEPFANVPETSLVYSVNSSRPFSPIDNKPGFSEDPQVLRHCRSRDVQTFGNFADGTSAGP